MATPKIQIRRPLKKTIVGEVKMDVEKLRENFRFMAFNGFHLNQDELTLLENSLVILQSDNKFSKIFYWGKILGTSSEYFIAFGFQKDCLQRKFFYSLDCLEWFLLKKPKQADLEASSSCLEPFKGDPNTIFKVEQKTKFEWRDGELVQEPATFVRLKEEDRLACIVREITENSAIIPRGALYARVDFNIVPNPYFVGLDRNEAPKLINYQLFREPQQRYNFNLLKREHYERSIDFLDTLDDQIPLSGSFALNMERDGEIVVIKSLHWLGMCFYHQVGTAVHGFFYQGDGRKNHDLLFML